MSDIIDRLQFAGRFGFETEEQAAARRIARNKEAADEIARLRAEVERERMRLVACGAVALADTESSAATARDMHPDYKSAACDDVARRVDECIRLRAEVARLEADAARYQWLRDQMWSQALSTVYALPIIWAVDYKGEEGKSMDAAIDAARAGGTSGGTDRLTRTLSRGW